MSEEGPNIKKLREEIERRGIINAHVSWGPGAEGLTPDERAKHILDIWERADAHKANTVLIPRADLQRIYEALSALTKLGQATVPQWDAMSKGEAKLRHEIFRLAEFPAVFAHQALSNSGPAAIAAAEHRGLIKGLEMAREIAAARADADWDASSVVDDIDSRLFSILERDASLQSEHKEGNDG